jgi:enoyl-[acyl-carrier protein] reductase II
MRVLRNRVVAEWADRIDEIPADTAGLPVIGHVDLPGLQTDLHKFSNLVPMRGATTGDLDEMPLLAGQGVGLVRAVEPVAEVIDRMVRDAAAAIRAIAADMAWPVLH